MTAKKCHYHLIFFSLLLFGCNRPIVTQGPLSDISFNKSPNLFQFGYLCGLIKSHPKTVFTPTQGMWQWWDLNLNSPQFNSFIHLYEQYTNHSSLTSIEISVFENGNPTIITIQSVNNVFSASGKTSNEKILSTQDISTRINKLIQILCNENDKYKYEHLFSHHTP